MKLTVIGCSPAWPNPGGAQSGYLVEGPGRLLLDCGPGVLAKLRERDGGWPRVDAIVITHWHLDHWGDLVPWVWGTIAGPAATGRASSCGCRRRAASGCATSARGSAGRRCGRAPSRCASTRRASRSRRRGCESSPLAAPALHAPHLRAPRRGRRRARSPTPATRRRASARRARPRRRPVRLRGDARARRPGRAAARAPLGRRGRRRLRGLGRAAGSCSRTARTSCRSPTASSRRATGSSWRSSGYLL